MGLSDDDDDDDDDCLGAAGCVASPMMIYAHLPWLLASCLPAKTQRGEGRDRVEVGDRVTGKKR